jgi:predicted nucleic acid-binding protein
MMKLRVYIDTSVIGGCLDEEFKDASRQLIDRFRKGEMVVVISELTTLELKNAPQDVLNILEEIPEGNTEYVELTEEAVSWNFRHIVNLQKIRRYNSVNLKYGYPLLETRSPREVITYEE